MKHFHLDTKKVIDPFKAVKYLIIGNTRNDEACKFKNLLDTTTPDSSISIVRIAESCEIAYKFPLKTEATGTITWYDFARGAFKLKGIGIIHFRIEGEYMHCW